MQAHDIYAEWRFDPPTSKIAERYLSERGYALRPDWHWDRPCPGFVMTERDWNAINYLIDEWKYGGLLVNGESFR